MADYGVDVDCTVDISANPGVASGLRNLGNALARRLITPRGALSYDATYGFDVRALVNASFTPSYRSYAAQMISRQCEQDERVLQCDTALTYNPAAQTLTIALSVLTNEGGAPYTFIMSVNALTTTFLQVA